MTNGSNNQGLAYSYTTPTSRIDPRTGLLNISFSDGSTGQVPYSSPATNTNANKVDFYIDDITTRVPGAGALGTGAGANAGGEKPGWFDPQGPSGRSLAGNVLGGVASGVGALSGLAGMYYGYEQMKMQKEMNKLQKDAYNRQVKKDEQQEARLKQLAKNVGNEASY